MDHQVTMEPEVSILSWVLSDPAGYKVECAQQHPLSDGSGVCVTRPKQVLGTSNYMKRLPKCLWFLEEAPLKIAWT